MQPKLREFSLSKPYMPSVECVYVCLCFEIMHCGILINMPYFDASHTYTAGGLLSGNLRQSNNESTFMGK